MVTTDSCCGRRPGTRQGDPLALACQLCPGSPTYWRTSPAPPPPVDPAPDPDAVDPDPVADWRDLDHWNRRGPQPCRLCELPAFLLDTAGRPAHKVCVEAAIGNLPNHRRAA